jgi:hypothetical protein
MKKRGGLGSAKKGGKDEKKPSNGKRCSAFLRKTRKKSMFLGVMAVEALPPKMVKWGQFQ